MQIIYTLLFLTNIVGSKAFFQTPSYNKSFSTSALSSISSLRTRRRIVSNTSRTSRTPTGTVSQRPSHILVTNWPKGKRFTLHSRREDDDSLLEKILSPFDLIVRLLSTPINKSLALPFIYPLSAILFNVFFNNATSITFDVVLAIFYILIQALDMDGVNEEDGQTIQQLVAISFFGSVATALLISPNGFDLRESFDSANALIPIASLLTLGFVGFLIVRASDRRDEEEEVDPSERLLELFDERLDKD
jgi:hypothetical protein